MIERYDIEQNTPEWGCVKLGMFSASTANELLMDNKNKGYINLINKIVEERITGLPCENKFAGNSYTERGLSLENEAALSFEGENFIVTKKVGVVIKNDWVLCSPDRLISFTEMLQIKCPIFSTQKEYLLESAELPPKNYYNQMQFELYVTDRYINYFYSYHPHLPCVQIEVYPDLELFEKFNKALEIAIKEVNKQIETIKNL